MTCRYTRCDIVELRCKHLFQSSLVLDLSLSLPMLHNQKVTRTEIVSAGFFGLFSSTHD